MKKEDTYFSELFSNFTPELSDKDMFISTLTDKLETIDKVKEFQESKIKRVKRFVIAAFVSGLAIGVLFIIGVMALYDNMQSYPLGDQILPIFFAPTDYRAISLYIIAFLLSIGLITIITQIQDICEWYQSRKKFSTHLKY